jgi:hypothetical protein
VVPDAGMMQDARDQMCVELKAAGFADVTMMSKPFEPTETPSDARVFAA